MAGEFFGNQPGSGKTNGKRGASCSRSYISSPGYVEKLLPKKPFKKNCRKWKNCIKRSPGKKFSGITALPRENTVPTISRWPANWDIKPSSGVSLMWIGYKNEQPTKEEAFDKLLSRIHPGAIVLLHNTSSTNGKILDELLTKNGKKWDITLLPSRNWPKNYNSNRTLCSIINVYSFNVSRYRSYSSTVIRQASPQPAVICRGTGISLPGMFCSMQNFSIDIAAVVVEKVRIQ